SRSSVGRVLSGAGTGRRVVGVGDRAAPAGRGRVAVVAFHQGQVVHEAVRGGAVPVLFARRGVDGVAGSRLDDGAVAAAEQGGGLKISMASFWLFPAVPAGG